MDSMMIHETQDYDKLELLPFNRNIRKTKALEESMRKYGFLTPYPLNVMENGNGKLKIKDGHHRYFVARLLAIPVKYVVSHVDITVREIDDATNKWTTNDYISGHCKHGDSTDYTALKRYCEESGIGIKLAVSLLSDSGKRNSNTNNFKDGEFKVSEQHKHAINVKNVVIQMKQSGIVFYNNSSLVSAISKILMVGELSIDQLMSKIKSHSAMFEKKASVKQYVDMLDKIYNYHTSVKIPLRFLSENLSHAKTGTKELAS